MDLRGGFCSSAPGLETESVVPSCRPLLQVVSKALQAYLHRQHEGWQIHLVSKFEGRGKEVFPLQQDHSIRVQLNGLDEQVKELCDKIEEAKADALSNRSGESELLLPLLLD